MKDHILFALLISTLALAFMLKKNTEEIDQLKSRLIMSELQLAKATENKATLDERNTFGPSCVNWIKELEEAKGTKGDFSLGRSWKKHGQLVFEVMTPKDADNMTLCLYDEQSGIMVLPPESERRVWMFY